MSLKKVKKPLSAHSKQRIIERANIKSNIEQLKFLNAASKKGLNPQDFSGDFKSWLENKGRFKRIKVYKGYILVFSKNSNFLYTIYPIPDKFKEEYDDKCKKNRKQIRK